jgi:putative phosphoesterase
MRLLVTSDTHLPRFGRSLPTALVDGLRHADLVLHCGDLTDAFVLTLLEDFAPTIAVAGNNDGPELTAELGSRAVVTVEDVRIGLTHGHVGVGRTTPERVHRLFAEEQPALDAICFGHSHMPLVERRGALWMLNPGSPTDRRRQPTFSYMMLDVRGRTIEPELVRYESRR